MSEVEKLLKEKIEEAERLRHRPEKWPSANMSKFYHGKKIAYMEALALLRKPEPTKESNG